MTLHSEAIRDLICEEVQRFRAEWYWGLVTKYGLTRMRR